MGGPRQRATNRSLKDLKREINARNGTQESRTPSKGDIQEVVNDQGKPFTASQMAASEPWTPSPYIAFKILISARLGAAVWSGISDCDETYNYWEPAHFLLYGQGMQTWEYDPKYALRSYFYLLVHALPAGVYASLAQPNPMLVFYFLRCLFGFICAMCEVYFYRGILCEFGANVGRLCLGFLVTSAGMFISSTAFLPSTTSMYLTLLSMGAWFHHNYKIAILTTAMSTFLSWPFAALLGAPIAFDLLVLKRRWRLFFTWSLLSCFVLLLPQVLCDSYYYGRLSLPPLNIVLYNVFTPHGPDLYGTEPASFYLTNGFLNFNFVFLAALLVLPVQLVARRILQLGLSSESQLFMPDTLSQAPLYLWLLVFWTRPHKEERFLFPIYPLICLAGAMVVDSLQKMFFFLFVKTKTRHFLAHTRWLGLMALGVTSFISMARVGALYQNYHGVTDLWMQVNQLPDPVGSSTTVCLGKEWYRYQSSFFLPSKLFKIAFLKSDFQGQLPKYFQQVPKGQLSTRLRHDDFNDLNLEEPSRYIAHPGKCHFLVDLDDGSLSDSQPQYSAHTNWTVEARFEFLDSAHSHPLARAFYLPWLSRRFSRFNDYLLLRRVSPRRISPSED